MEEVGGLVGMEKTGSGEDKKAVSHKVKLSFTAIGSPDFIGKMPNPCSTVLNEFLSLQNRQAIVC
jgi:hypothetical protein